ncbi:hypothetical protein I3760_03G043000 [Carya illinoinensis]|nr:hypothetical protein I3760_03G043000 [Carya illinoinensis]
MKTLHDRDQEEKVLQFLMGLHDSYTVIRGQILLMNPLLPLHRSYALVLKEENQREITNSLYSSDSMTLAVNQSFLRSHYASNSNRNGQVVENVKIKHVIIVANLDFLDLVTPLIDAMRRWLSTKNTFGGSITI